MLIIPDIHGRTFWREPVAEALETGESIIFLGDYVDPYHYEGVPLAGLVLRLEQIVKNKRAHPEQLTLLLGNHDLHYLDDRLGGSRYDIFRAAEYSRIFKNNADAFQIASVRNIGGKRFVFTHAGIQKGWLEQNKDLFADMAPDDIPVALNSMWADETQWPELFSALSDVSYARGGSLPYGSPVWNDVNEMEGDNGAFPGWYQVFGHTQQEKDPVITESFACLDCRRAFRIDADGNISA